MEAPHSGYSGPEMRALNQEPCGASDSEPDASHSTWWQQKYKMQISALGARTLGGYYAAREARVAELQICMRLPGVQHTRRICRYSIQPHAISQRRIQYRAPHTCRGKRVLYMINSYKVW